MSTSYTYTLLLKDGNKVNGSIEAANLAEAQATLQQQGLLLSLKASKQPTRKRKQPITLLEVMLFSKQMGTMLKSGVPIIRALNAIASSDSAITPVVMEIQEKL